MAEKNEISAHEVRVHQAVISAGTWVTSKYVAEAAGVAARTARQHLFRLVNLGIIDQEEVFPGHRYRASEFAEKRNKTYVQRLARAKEVLGL